MKSLFPYYFNHKPLKIDALNRRACHGLYCSGKIRPVMWQIFNLAGYSFKASYKLAIVFISGAMIFLALAIYYIGYSKFKDIVT